MPSRFQKAKSRCFSSIPERADEFLSTQEGYLSAQLHRSLSPRADFRFVNVALWQSVQSFRAATTKPEFEGASIPFPFHASLYEVARGRVVIVRSLGPVEKPSATADTGRGPGCVSPSQTGCRRGDSYHKATPTSRWTEVAA